MWLADAAVFQIGVRENAIESGATYAQELGRKRFVALKTFEHAMHVRPLDFVEGGDRSCAIGLGWFYMTNVFRQIFNIYCLSVGHHTSVSEDVFKLADISRP